MAAQDIIEYEDLLEREAELGDEFEYLVLDQELQLQHPDSLDNKQYLFARLRHGDAPTDTTTNWWKLLWRGKIELDNPNVYYPKFPRFCFNVYYWADKFFNGQDKQYVAGTGKRWKARLISDNWVDSYALNIDGKMNMWLLSDFNINAGAYIQFMAVSVGISHDVREILGRKKQDHKKMEFGFNCARFNIEAFYMKNDEGSHLRHFGDYNNGHIFKMDFPGLKQERFGVNASFFINNKRYSQGAAYNFSKIQLRSTGSPIVGFVYNHLNLDINLSNLDEALRPYLTVDPHDYRFHYNTYTFMVGYGYNWVCNPHILYNITLTPSFGWCHAYEDSVDNGGFFYSMNILARTSLTYNLNDFFVCALGKFDGNFYHSKRFNMLNFLETLQLNVGFRF